MSPVTVWTWPAWRPIETAPVGADLLLVWRPVDHEARPLHREIVIGSLLHNDNGEQSGVAWVNGREYDVATHFTHWMHQPPLPIP